MANDIVPQLKVKMNVMMMTRNSGMDLPPTVSANTSAGCGQGTCVDIRTFMYEIRNDPKTKVSPSRKIHIITLAQGTFLNARWSQEKSAMRLCRPSGGAVTAAVLVGAGCVM